MDVFSYGTLMFPEVLEALTEKHFEFEELSLAGYERRLVRGEIYPAVREEARSRISGRLWFDIDDLSLEILDFFEDVLYEHRNVELASERRGLSKARLYVVPKHLEARLSDALWYESEFREKHLVHYLPRCRNYRAEFFASRPSNA